MKRCVLLTALVLFTAPSLEAAGFLARAKSIVASIKNKEQTAPTNPFMASLSDAYVRAYPSQWSALLEMRGAIINPATKDPMDIGVMAGDVFQPYLATAKNMLKAEHYVRMMREYNRQILAADRLQNSSVSVEDIGKRPQEILNRISEEITTEVKTELGDPTTDSDD